MLRNRYYFYDHETCSFHEVKKSRSRVYAHAFAVLSVAFLLASAIAWGVDEFTQTPQELALQTENDALARELAEMNRRLDTFSNEIDQLAESDQQLYRTLFQADPIPDDVRQVGVGGVDPYEKYSRFSIRTAILLRDTAEKLDRLERQINLGNSSYRELMQLADDREEQLRQLPAILPATGPVVSGYGIRYHTILRVRRMHHGIDIVVDTGSPVAATGDGIVRTTEFSTGYGNYVVIDHPAIGYSTLYAHLSEIPSDIRPGRAVVRGEPIGYSGNTGLSSGPHVHYEVRDAEGQTVNPIFFVAPSMTPEEYQKLVEETERSTVSLD